MKILILLFAVFILVKAQINQTCLNDTDCQNGAAPCTSANCICDPMGHVCKLDLHQPCPQGQGYCRSGTRCRAGQCLASEGQPCGNDEDCIPNGSCVVKVNAGVCRAQPHFAWDPVSATYGPCGSDCATCFAPNDNTACLNCTDPNKYVMNGACVCRSGASTNASNCQPCDSRCATCAVPNSMYGCTSCARSEMILISGVCLCPQGTAWNPNTRTCAPCHSSCQTCSRPNNPRYCTSCSTGTLIAGTCVMTCLDPHTAPGSRTCEECAACCRTCLVPGDPNRCTSCPSGKKLVGGACLPYNVKYKAPIKATSTLKPLTIPKTTGKVTKVPPKSCGPHMLEINGVCKCKEGYVGDSRNPKDCDKYCLPCSPTCRTCFAPNNPYACTSCWNGLLPVNGSCVPGQSLPGNCAYECLSCTVSRDPSQCLTCSIANALFLGGTCYCQPNTFRMGNFCVPACDAPCTECYINSSSICTACPSGMTPIGGTCTCPNGTALNDNGQCAPCDVSCRTCASPGNPAACTSCMDPIATLTNGRCECPDPFMIYNSSGQCVCPPDRRLVFSGLVYLCVVQLCSPGTFPGPNGTGCLPCSSNCLNCTDETHCNQCQDGFYVDANGSCSPCPTNCSTCSSGSLCTVCTPGYVLIGGLCSLACPSCCPTCTYDPSGNPVCSSCLRDLMYVNGTCMACAAAVPGCVRCRGCGCQRCANGYFRFNSTLCVLCNSTMPGCTLCNGPGSCLSCAPPYVLNVTTRRCVLQLPPPMNPCPTGKYMSPCGKCLPCYETCRNCVGPGGNMCTDCYYGLTFYPDNGNPWGICSCDPGYIFDPKIKVCTYMNTYMGHNKA